MAGNLLGNWVPDTNKFGLPTPPDWALKKLWDFDHMLVLVPSRKDRHYLLTRRRQHSAGLGDAAMLDNAHPDTNMCYGMGVVPVQPIVSRSGEFLWTEGNVDELLAALKRRDTWAAADAAGGVDALVDQIEYAEELEKRKRTQALKQDFFYRGREAWRSIKARTGQRNKRASDFHGAAQG